MLLLFIFYSLPCCFIFSVRRGAAMWVASIVMPLAASLKALAGYGRVAKMQISTECGCPAGNFISIKGEL
jgi:hypothetical protein